MLELAQNIIHENEGDRLKVYKCPAGKLTIGRGRNLEDKGLSQDESDYLLTNDIHEAHTALQEQLAFYSDLSEERQVVLIDMYHNLGLRGLLGFKKMLTALRNSQFDEAARQIHDSKYFQQVGVRAKRNYCMMMFGSHYEKEEAEAYWNNETRRSFGI